MGLRRVSTLAVLAAAALLATSALAVSAGVAANGNPTRGKVVFLKAGIFCGSCHTLAAAKSKGRDGPNLDKKKPSYARIVDVVTKGRKTTRRWPTGMPAYTGRHAALTKTEIRNVAAFVYAATHR